MICIYKKEKNKQQNINNKYIYLKKIAGFNIL